MKLSSPDQQSDWLAREGLLRVAHGNSGEARGQTGQTHLSIRGFGDYASTWISTFSSNVLQAHSPAG